MCHVGACVLGCVHAGAFLWGAYVCACWGVCMPVRSRAVRMSVLGRLCQCLYVCWGVSVLGLVDAGAGGTCVLVRSCRVHTCTRACMLGSLCVPAPSMSGSLSTSVLQGPQAEAARGGCRQRVQRGVQRGGRGGQQLGGGRDGRGTRGGAQRPHVTCRAQGGHAPRAPSPEGTRPRRPSDISFSPERRVYLQSSTYRNIILQK